MSEKKEILEESKKLIEKYKLLPFSEGVILSRYILHHLH